MTTSVSTRAAETLNPTRQQLDELDALLQRMLELPVNKIEEEEQEENEEPTNEPTPAVQLTPSHPLVPVKETPPPSPPVSYMVVETASPRPLPPASGFETRSSMLKPQLVPVTPVKAVEDKPGPVAPAPSNETPVPPSSSTPVLPSDGETWVPLRSTWKPSPQTWPPLADSWHQANGPTPALDLANVPSSNPLDQTPATALMPPSSSPALLPSEKTENHETPTVEPRLSLSAEDAPKPVPWTLQPLLWFNQGFDACTSPLGTLGCWLRGPGRQLLGFVGMACLTAAVVIAVTAGLGWTWWSSLVE